MMLDLIKMKLVKNKALIFTVYLPSIRQNRREFWMCLSDQEKDQAEKFRTETLKEKYILSHGFLRKLLSCYVIRDPQHIEYQRNRYGKPSLAHNDGVNFNMSHSHDFAAYAIVLDCDVGIDIEWVDNELNNKDIFDLVLSPSELLYFDTLNLKEQQKVFYTTWTKKEAIVKAVGKGLSYPIKEITVTDSNQSDQPHYEVNQNRIYYRNLENLGHYAGAVALSQKIDIFLHMDYSSGKIVSY